MEKTANKSKARINLSGVLDLIKKSKYPLTPLYEAITNSLEAISQRDMSGNEEPLIEITLNFTGLMSEVKELQSIEVVDNGEGFTSENYLRFQEFFDKSKGYDNKGTGRLQFLHRFEKIEFKSVYEIEGSKRIRNFTCDAKHFIQNEEDGACTTKEKVLTKIVLSNGISDGKEKNFLNELTIDKIINDIKRHFLLRFYLDAKKEELASLKISVIFVKNGTEIGRQSLDSKNMPAPQETGDIKVPYLKIVDTKADQIEWKHVKDKDETINWAHFKVPEDGLEKNNIYLCSKNLPIQALDFNQIKKDESLNGFRYLTAFYGDVLDKAENVSDTVDSFKFPDKKEIEKGVDDLFFNPDEEFLFFDSIKEQVKKAIPDIYKDIYDHLNKLGTDVEEIARSHGIPIDVALKTKINLTDSEKTITKKIYASQSNGLAEKGFQAKKLHESLNKLNPTADNYQEELKNKTIELSALIEEQNKEELSRYVIRREMVANILEKILTEELEHQVQTKANGKRKDKEGLIHDLIFKRKSADTSVLNDLWVLDEEFLHFDGCSDLPLNQIVDSQGNKLLKDLPNKEIDELKLNIDRRPDIFLFAKEGKCVLVELKAPDVDMSGHLNQMVRYCNIIANYSEEKLEKFYCFLIGEKIEPGIDLSGDYEETVNGDWLKASTSIRSNDNNRNKIGTIKMELIKLSSLHLRAHRRNQSFAEKLKLPELLNSK